MFRFPNETEAELLNRHWLRSEDMTLVWDCSAKSEAKEKLEPIRRLITTTTILIIQT